MKNTTVLICYGNSTISKAISLFTESKITHTGFKKINDEEIFIADSQNDGFKLRKYIIWEKKYNYKYEEFEIPVTYKNVNKNIYDHLDETPYDFRLFVLRYPKHILSKIFGNKNKIDSVKNESDREICSESVAHCLGWENPENYLPIDVYNRILLEGWRKIS